MLGHLWIVGICSLILFPLFATSVVDTCGKFIASVIDTGGNLPPVANFQLVSTTLVKLVAKFAAFVVDTGGKFATGIFDTGTLTCEYLREFSKKFRNGPNEILWGLGKTDS